ncbi:MAG: ABC transporter ATP-binding protein, partial [Candidatus Gallimonas sp.]
MLRLSKIKKDYRVADSTVHALKGIDLEFRRNEFVCILGQSGCGKTTLLNIIGGLDQYTSGDLIIDGKSTKAFTDRDWDVYRNHRIGFIFQSYNLIPHQTVLGNVEIALTIAGIGKAERRERAKKALERVGLQDHLNKRPNQLSGGQMQRVAIARALVNNPSILLADEPTGALDSATSVQIMDLIREIAGERLVIMVTHNPELAEQYASRIVRLKDGQVESDSNPYDGTEERLRKREAVEKRREEWKANPELRKSAKKKFKANRKKSQKASMGFFTALALSARNLLTKKGRTIVTSVAGSIGIISVCLVLALSNGFHNYIIRTEEDMLSFYPVEITENAFDMTSILAGMQSKDEMPDLEQIGDKVYVNSFLTGIAQGMTVTNDITKGYVDYIEATDSKLYNAIQYDYGTVLTDNLATSVVVGESSDNTETKYMSLSNLKQFYINELTQKASEYGQLAYMVDYLGGVVHRMPDTSDVSDAAFGDYILSQYDVIAGEFPKAENEAVLVVGGNNDVTDLTLAQLGFISEPDFLSLFSLGENAEEGSEQAYMRVEFQEILDKSFVLLYNDAVYRRTDGTTGYAFDYQGTFDDLNFSESDGVHVKVSGILRLKDGLTYGCLKSGLNLTEALVDDYIEQNMTSELVRWMNDDANKLNLGGKYSFYRSPAERLNEYYQSGKTIIDNLDQEIKDQLPTFLRTLLENSYIAIYENQQTQALRSVGGSHEVAGIFIYAKDFDTKDALLARLDAWNNDHEEGEQITYTDRVGLLMSIMQTMLDAITYVL